MTVDHIPEGYIGFKEAFEKYCEKVASTDFKVLPEDCTERGVQAEELDECADNFVAAFAAGELTGYFRDLQFQGNSKVSRADWTSPVASLACWRDGLDIAGRSAVIFIDASVFSEWLAGVRKRSGSRDQKKAATRHRHGEWVDLAKQIYGELKTKNDANADNVSRMARLVLKSVETPARRDKGKAPAVETIRRVLGDRKAEWQ